MFEDGLTQMTPIYIDYNIVRLSKAWNVEITASPSSVTSYGNDIGFLHLPFWNKSYCKTTQVPPSPSPGVRCLLSDWCETPLTLLTRSIPYVQWVSWDTSLWLIVSHFYWGWVTKGKSKNELKWEEENISLHNLQFLSMILTIGEIENQQNTKVYEHSATEANLPFR